MSNYMPTYDLCQCDGQYSEHETCRIYNIQAIFNVTDIRSYGACSISKKPIQQTINFRFHKFIRLLLEDPQFLPCTTDTRPILLFIQAGFNGIPPDAIIRDILQPIMKRVRHFRSTCVYNTKVYIIFTGANCQKRELDEYFPTQSREIARAFNLVLQKYINRHHKEIKILDFFPMTVDAASVDGYHYLSSVNIQKANSVLRLMEAMLRDTH